MTDLSRPTCPKSRDPSIEIIRQLVAARFSGLVKPVGDSKRIGRFARTSVNALVERYPRSSVSKVCTLLAAEIAEVTGVELAPESLRKARSRQVSKAAAKDERLPAVVEESSFEANLQRQMALVQRMASKEWHELIYLDFEFATSGDLLWMEP